jgi:hypothetical protein
MNYKLNLFVCGFCSAAMLVASLRGDTAESLVLFALATINGVFGLAGGRQA